MLTGMKILVAVFSLFVLLLVFQVANAGLPSNPTVDELYEYCKEKGGLFSPFDPVSGVYWCLLPDGTLIACGGAIPICTQSFTHQDKELGLSSVQAQTIKDLAAEYGKSRIRGEANLKIAEIDARAVVWDQKSNMAAIESALKKLEAAHTASRLEEVNALRAASAVLTPEVIEKWRSRIEMRRGVKGE